MRTDTSVWGDQIGVEQEDRAAKKQRVTEKGDDAEPMQVEKGQAPQRKQENGGSAQVLKLAGFTKGDDAYLGVVLATANDHWLCESASDFDGKLIEDLYTNVILQKDAKLKSRRLGLLEISQYLEKYLLEHFSADHCSKVHVMSILALVNEKFHQGVPGWACFDSKQDTFELLMQKVLSAVVNDASSDDIVLGDLEAGELSIYLQFLIFGFQSIENALVRAHFLRVVSLNMWHHLPENRLEFELAVNPKLNKYWAKLGKREAKEKKKAASEGKEHKPYCERIEAVYVPKLVDCLMERLFRYQPEEDTDDKCPSTVGTQNYEYFLQLILELLSQLPTRRFVRTFLVNQGFVMQCKYSSLYSNGRGKLFKKILSMIESYMKFEVSDHDGHSLSDDEVLSSHYEFIQKIQMLAFKYMPKLNEFALANCKRACQREFLEKEIGKLSDADLRKFVTRQCRILNPDCRFASDREFLQDVLLSSLERPVGRKRSLEMLPLYPTEKILWDEDLVPSSEYDGESCLALPKLNLQFLTLRDYLLRNYTLYRLEAAYEIREDINDLLPRMGAHLDENDEVQFSGWSRMAMQVTSVNVTEIGPPALGEEKPSFVYAEVEYDLSSARAGVQLEWDGIQEHDVLFLLALSPPEYRQEKETPDIAKHVRGCEVIEIRDGNNRLMNDFTGRTRPENTAPPSGSKRTLLVSLDTTQFHADSRSGNQRIYSSFNLVMRRQAKESNFKAVLECIRSLGREDVSLPEWLNDTFLGYGDPATSNFTSMEEQKLEIDFRDTFLDLDHLRSCFTGWNIDLSKEEKDMQPPFKVRFEQPFRMGISSASGSGEASLNIAPGSMHVESYDVSQSGPYPQDSLKINPVRFTDVQSKAILSGMQPGLTMVVGPPGTGKTDIATQILELLYHNYPNQRILLITHSNQALNDLFMKIMNRNVPSRYLLRLGMGEQELDTDEKFSRVGRVNAMLERRLSLLGEVERLTRSMGLSVDFASTCETCAHFWLLHVLSKWEQFLGECKKDPSAGVVSAKFPFEAFFQDAPQPLFAQASFEQDMAVAEGCFEHLQTIFKEIEECRPFELLQSQRDRLNYLMTKQAKIVAMTCTYAAMKRHDFVKLAIQYDSIVMEESAQALDIETLIPMHLQKEEDGTSRLKRCVLIGDHNQLPPVIKNMSFKQFSNLDQSLFTRLIRLGVPHVQLDAQGRSRASIAALFSWKYIGLGNLGIVEEQPEFQLANAGFKHEYQVIDVPDYNGQGEFAPTPHFIQNLGEAEHVVTLFQHMRLMGYPGDRITILTTYNGQKALLRDVVEKRCAHHPLFGRPHKIETVDKYQGQQNDYVILSLVRTKSVGHLRDVRRLVVAMSRARLGLYVFCRVATFRNCFELQPTFRQLLQRPDVLQIVPKESHPCTRKVDEDCEAVPTSMEALSRQVVEGVQHWEMQQHQQP